MDTAFLPNCDINAEGERAPKDSFTEDLYAAVEKARIDKYWRKEYMTLQEHYRIEREEGRAEGRAEEQKNTERERLRAETAEKKLSELEKKIADLEQKLELLQKESM